MPSVPGQVKVYLCLAATDMRKSFDSLAAVVEEQLRFDPLSGHLFVFRSKRGDRVKLLYGEEGGYCLWYRRLEAGTFRFPAPAADDQRSLAISAADLTRLLDGVDLASVKRRPRYARPASAAS